jgi:hypothetical protein
LCNNGKRLNMVIFIIYITHMFSMLYSSDFVKGNFIVFFILLLLL